MTSAKGRLKENCVRKFQFSISTLLYLTLFVSIVLSVIAVLLYRWRADVEGETAVRSLGGSVYELSGWPWEEDSYWVDLCGTHITDDQLIALAPKLKRMTYVKFLMVDSPNVSREVLPHLRGFPRLWCLSMSGTQIPQHEILGFCMEEGIPGTGWYASNSRNSAKRPSAKTSSE